MYSAVKSFPTDPVKMENDLPIEAWGKGGLGDWLLSWISHEGSNQDIVQRGAE